MILRVRRQEVDEAGPLLVYERVTEHVHMRRPSDWQPGYRKWRSYEFVPIKSKNLWDVTAVGSNMGRPLRITVGYPMGPW